MGATDLKLVVRAGAIPEAQTLAVTADLAFALASTGEAQNAEKMLAPIAAASGDDAARVALARAAIARASNDSTTVDAELARARDAAVSDEARRLIDAFSH